MPRTWDVLPRRPQEYGLFVGTARRVCPFNPARQRVTGLPARLADGQGLKVPRSTAADLSPGAGTGSAHWVPRSRTGGARFGYTSPHYRPARVGGKQGPSPLSPEAGA